MFPGDQRSPLWASLLLLRTARYFQKWLWWFRLVFCLLSGLTRVCVCVCVYSKHFLPSALFSIFSGSHGFRASAQAWALCFSALQRPGLLRQACRSLTCVQSNLWITLSFSSFFFSTECFYWMTWTFSLWLCLWHHLWCSCSWNFSTSVPSGEKATCVLVPVAAWCSSVRVWGSAHVWLPGAPASVSVGAHVELCGVLVFVVSVGHHSCSGAVCGSEAAISLALDYSEKHHRRLPTPKACPVAWFFIKTLWSHAVFSIEEKL